MGDALLLVRLELKSLFGINRYRHSKNRKERSNFRLLACVWGLLGMLVFFYVGGLVYGLSLLGLGSLAPGYLTMVASVLIFVFDFFRAGKALFGRRGYDLLAPLPLRSGAIALGRFLSLYVQDLLLALAVLAPGLGVYAVLNRPGLSFYPLALAGFLLVPAIPLTLAALPSLPVMLLSSRAKHKSLVETALMLALVVGILLGSFSLGNASESITPDQLAGLSQTVDSLIGSVYPPARWLGSALAGEKMAGFLPFAGLCLGLGCLMLWLLSRLHPRLMERLSAFSARHSYRLGSLERSSLGKGLYLREARRYFSSSLYVTNTIVGPIVGAMLAGAVCFGGLEALSSQVPVDLRSLLPLVLGGVFTMMTTTSCSISMEGRQIWLLQSLPIPAKQLLDAKVALNLSLMAPFYLLSGIFLIAGLRPSPGELFLLLLYPAALILFTAVLGITVNLKLHRFDWEKEEQVVKQSASAALGGFAGPLVTLPLAAATVLLPQYAAPIQLAAAALLLTAAILLRKANSKARLETL